jgi:hypothetical protein
MAREKDYFIEYTSFYPLFSLTLSIMESNGLLRKNIFSGKHTYVIIIIYNATANEKISKKPLSF